MKVHPMVQPCSTGGVERPAKKGVGYVTAEVSDINRTGSRISGVTLASGETITAGTVITAAGPRAAATAHMSGIELPIEPGRRYTFVFTAEQPVERDLLLTIDLFGRTYSQ